MKRILVCALTALLALSGIAVRPARAQSGNSPAGPIGEVRGTIMNSSSGEIVAQNLEIMLHVLNHEFIEQDMKHAQSESDGTFFFAEVPFDANLQFAVMAIYDGVTYFSDVTPADMTSLLVEIEVRVYESTSDLAGVRLDQMHVRFDFAEDGLETREIYVFSNSGRRTVKDVYDLGNDQFASLQFPLPSDADYIFFKPEDQDRFVKLSNGFADTYPILPGVDSAQIMVTYLVPYPGERTYTYTAPLNISRINFLVPDQLNISLEGQGLAGPEPMSLQNGKSYLVYSYSDLNAGETVNVSISGKLAGNGVSRNINTPIAVSIAFLGFAVIGAGIWWWRRPDEVDDETVSQPDAESNFELVIREIAQLDQVHEKGEIDGEEYHRSREALRNRAKTLMEQKDQGDNEAAI